MKNDMDIFTHNPSIQKGAASVNKTWNIKKCNDASLLEQIESIPGINRSMLYTRGPFKYIIPFISKLETFCRYQFFTAGLQR